MNNSVSTDIYGLIDKQGQLDGSVLVPAMQKPRSIMPKMLSFGARRSKTPKLGAGGPTTKPLYIGTNNFQGNDLKSSGVFLSGGTFQGPNIFASVVPAKFQGNVTQQTFTHVVSTESEKNSLISNLAEISGHYGNISGSASLSFANEMHVTQTSLSVIKYAYISIGTKVFDFSNLKLSDNVIKLLDPTLPENQDPKKYLDNISNFLSTYGYYYINSYELYGELLASWQIETISKKDKQEINSKLSGEVTTGAADFSAVNNFVYETSSSFEQSSSTYRSLGIGINKNIQTIDQLNDVFNDFQSSIDQNSAIISKVFISPWISLDQIAIYISQIKDSKLRGQVTDLLNGPKLTQDIWNRMLFLQSSMLNLRSRIELSIDDPYNNDFWGFLTDYSTLPIKELGNLVTQINSLLDELDQIDERNYTASFLTFQKKYDAQWKKIQNDYINFTNTPKYAYYVQTGFFSGNVTGELSGYTIVQGTHTTAGFDAASVQINSAFYTSPVFQRPYFLATAWQQGVMNFKKLDKVDKKANPFVIQLECRLAWTGHLNWDTKFENMHFNPGQTKTLGASVYDTTLMSARLAGIIGVAFTLEQSM